MSDGLPKILCPNCKRRWLMSGWFVGQVVCKTCNRLVDIVHFDEEAIKAYIQKNSKAA